MKSASDIVIKLLGGLLIVAAVLKGWQLLTEPVAGINIWSNRAFLILTVEIELALGIWLVSGLFKKAAWLVGIFCFGFFSCLTLYKGISGDESCGCFGSVHVNPWITLFAVDIPAIIVLAAFRPALLFLRKQKSIAAFVRNILTPLPSIPHFATFCSVSIVILTVTGCVLGFNEPENTTSVYEVLEPEEWVGKQLSIMKHIDIADHLARGRWLVLFYHYDCPDCVTAIRTYKSEAEDLPRNEDFLKIAFIEVPPYRISVVNANSKYAIGKLLNVKEWFITTPAVVLLESGTVRAIWEGKVPDLDAVFKSKNIETLNKSPT